MNFFPPNFSILPVYKPSLGLLSYPKKCEPDQFSCMDVYWIQTDTQLDRQAKRETYLVNFINFGWSYSRRLPHIFSANIFYFKIKKMTNSKKNKDRISNIYKQMGAKHPKIIIIMRVANFVSSIFVGFC